MNTKIDPTKWHRMPTAGWKQCVICGCPAGELSSPVQQHRQITAADDKILRRILATPKVDRRSKLIEKGKMKWITREGTTSIEPPLNTQRALRQAARAVAAGMKMTDAARSANSCIATFERWRQNFPEFWEKTLRDAREEFDAGGFSVPVLPDSDEDPGIRPETKSGIRAAVAILAAGLTHAEAEKELHLTPGAIATWQKDHPRYYSACLQLATRVSATIVKTLENSPTSLPVFRMIAAAEKRDRTQFDRQEAAYAELSGNMTLTEFYFSYILPVCQEPRGLKNLSFVEYETTLRHWQQYTGDPPVKSIDARTCANFVKKLSQRISEKSRDKVSPNTVRKHCTALQYMLDKLGPRSRHNRLGTGLVQDVPYLERPRPRPKPPTDQFTIEELQSCLAACESATEPKNLRGITPATWWTALVLFLYNSGFRIGTVMELEWSMLEGRTLKVPGRIYKGGYDKEFPLSDHALKALEPLQVLRKKYDKIFPWPFTRTSLQRHRERLLELAGLPPERRFGFHGLRKALATAVASIDFAAAQSGLGHTSLKTTADHYIHPDVMVAVLNRVPQPRQPG